MSTTITLQDLIEKVKEDLFSPVEGTSLHGKKAYPIFLVDQVELEVNVELSYSAESGLTIQIPQVAQGSVGGGQEKVSGHRMKITLKPTLSTEELRALIKADPRLFEGIKKASLVALHKGVGLAGAEE